MKQPGESDSAASLRIAQSWLGGVVTAAKAAKPDVKVYMYDIWAVYDSGYQITSCPKPTRSRRQDLSGPTGPAHCRRHFPRPPVECSALQRGRQSVH